MTIEMEDAIMRVVLEHLFGIKENGTTGILSVNDLYPTEVVLYGETFIVNDQGQKEWINIYMPHFIPDGLLNLTLESEGDFTVLSMSGEPYPDTCGNFIAIIEGDGTDPCRSAV